MFGRGVEYSTVKQRLIDEFTSRPTLGTNDFSDFFAATTRLSGESLACFEVRLESSAGRVTGVNEGSRDMLVRCKVLRSLPPSILKQVNVQLCHQDDPSLKQIVMLAQVLETMQSVGVLDHVIAILMRYCAILLLGKRRGDQVTHC